MRKIWSILLCCIMLFMCIPAGLAEEVPAETPVASNNADLDSLSMTEGTLTPEFAATIFEYAVTVPYEVSSVNITSTKADVNAEVSITGPADNLAVGANAIAVEVTAEDGETINIYTITVTRAEEVPAETPVASSNADLKSLSVSPGTLAQDFAADTLQYAVDVPYETTSIEITAEAADSNANLIITGPADNLAVGANAITVEVTAADKETVNIYTIMVTRAEEVPAETPAASSNAELDSLGVSPGTLTQDFAADTLQYAVDLPYEITSIEITAVAADSNANLNITGPTDDLAVGANEIAVEVTAEDGETVNVYTITVTRAEPELRLLAAAEENPLPLNAADYAASDYATYGDRMAIGVSHIAVIDADGNLTVGGDNTYGQCSVPEALNGVTVKAVAAGSYHTLALTTEGRVYAWGQAYGSGSSDPVYPVSIPAEVEALQGSIKMIAAGSTMSAVVTTSDQLIVWGYNSCSLASVPTVLSNIVDLAINSYCVVVLEGNGNVTVWGDTACGTEPANLDGDVVSVAAGQWHWLALQTGGTVSVTGSDSMLGECGLIAAESNVRAIAGGWQFAGVILADGSVKAWGRTPAGYDKSGLEQIPASANVKAFTSVVSDEVRICAMQGDGSIVVLAPEGFSTAPIPDNFNFLGNSGTNADLSSLSVSPGNLNEDFAASTTAYTVDVPYETTSIQITATTADASLTIGGQTVPSGEAKTVSGLAVGENPIAVVVTAQDGTTVKTYTITVTRAAAAVSNNANLIDLSVNNYRLNQDFDPEITSYAISIPNEADSVEITAIIADTNASSLTIGGQTAASDEAKTVSGLAVGENPIDITVTAQDGTTVKIYTITVTRAAETASNNADLSALKVGSLALDTAITEHAITIDAEASSVAITATTADTNASSLTIGGQTVPSGEEKTVSGLAVGENPIAITVTAQDAKTVKTYTITVTRPISTNADLASLSVETYDGTDTTVCGIYPKFSSSQTEGIIDAAYGVSEVRINAQPSSSTATMKIDGTPVIVGETVVINGTELSVGDNPIEIEVTAASGSQRIYTLHVKKVSADYSLPALPQTPAAYQESEYARYSRRLAAYNHVLAVKPDGTVAAWGDNQHGECNMPPEVNDVVAVSAGNGYSLALKADGTVVAWGQNDLGQCTIPEALKGQVVVDICAVGKTSLALDQDGNVTAWGDTANGITALTDLDFGTSTVVDIQGASNYVLALKADGTVVAWGNNSYGQCEVADLDHVVAVAAGWRQSIALKDDGTMVIRGAEGTRYEIENLNLQHVRGIAGGYRYVAALKWDGSVAIWGLTTVSVPLEPENNPLAIIAPSGGSIRALLAFNDDGTVKIWENTPVMEPYIPSGLNLLENEEPYEGPSPDIPQTPAEYAASDYVQAAAKICHTGNGLAILNMDGTVKYIPVAAQDDFNLAQIPEGLNSVTAITSSSSNIMALKKNGTVVVWGLNEDGQCQVPDSVQDITAITVTQSTNDCCLALKDNGTLIAWGNYYDGKCQVPDGLDNVTAIAAGDDHFLALKADGTVAAWGKNDYGQCNVPDDLNEVAHIFACGDYSMALKYDGTVAAWGSNLDPQKQKYCGQCDVPEGLSGVVDIRLWGSTCIALKNNGTVIVWGDNSYGGRHIPVGLHDVAAINIDSNGFMAIKTDGTIEFWGHGSSFNDEILNNSSNVLTVSNRIIVFRDGTLQFYSGSTAKDDAINLLLEGLNVLSGHYFKVTGVDLLNSAGNSITSVPSQGGYRIRTEIDNNYASPTNGLTIIQVRGGDSASTTSGGQVLGCVGISSEIPLSGAVVSSDFTLPANISGEAYVDVFVWEDWETMIPRAAANQNLSFTVSE